MTRTQVLTGLNHNNPAGEVLIEVSTEELAQIYGGGDVQPETTTVCAVGGGIALGIALSKLFC
ncbi:lichenicidin A2 family type 2 lantibiotic [Neobacillus mesonae]|uniref:mersacidin family lantibiotic n=1 Tax=Neobacillus mesonae TaxID=1193713 RepID=UPI002E224E1D|nr:mersacidin family lantibiotic [Neobacillus mesonae]MED4206663.1 mersacidin family lantibiotic [Neobacillus mesonae]